MLIGGDDISNDVITLARYFSTFAYIRARLRFALIGGNLTAQSMGSHRGIGGGIQIPETELQALLPFPALPPERLGELAHRICQPWICCGSILVRFIFLCVGILVMYDNGLKQRKIRFIPRIKLNHNMYNSQKY